MQNRQDITRGRINGAAAARDTNNELPPFARPPPPRGRPESGLAQRVAAARLGAGLWWPKGVGRLHVLEAPTRIRKPSRERRGGSFGGSAKDPHGE